MFGIAKDRVGRNGGIIEHKNNNGGFDKDYGWDEGDGADEEKRRQLLEEGDYLDENETLGKDDEREEEKEDEPEEFTMGKMLRIMGIEKEMLGWDSETSTWV
jgi:Swi5-dependent recombination DNA repair protein 1